MKRMVLVPEDAVNRYEQRQRLETSPIMSNMIHKDTQMSNVLQRDGMNDDQKQKLFNAELERYLELRQQKDSPIRSVRVVKDEKEQPLPEPAMSNADVVDSMPPYIRQRATSLLNRLKTRPEVITWDKTGQVKIEGETIPNSNISDLISDAMRSRKDFNPTGAKKFFQALSKLNVPKDLVRDQNRWKQLDDTPDVSTPKGSDRYPALMFLESYKEKETLKRWMRY